MDSSSCMAQASLDRAMPVKWSHLLPLVVREITFTKKQCTFVCMITPAVVVYVTLSLATGDVLVRSGLVGL